ncbi:MAG TPA: GWxTD domain-containing protein [Longimicrobiales bacterium]
MRVRSLLFSAFFVLLPAFLTAQSPSPETLQDSLAVISDVPLLHRMERPLPAAAAASTPWEVLQRGFIEHRIWQLTGDASDAKRARQTFEDGAERFAADPWIRYGWARALADGPETRLRVAGGVLSDVTIFQSVGEILKRDPRSRARGQLRRALQLNPAFGEAALLLADLAVADGGRSSALVREARDVLAAARAAGATQPEVGNKLARMETLLGNYAAATAVTEANAASGDAGALKARAEALLLQPSRQAEGAQLYARALDAPTEEAVAAMFLDVQVLMNATEAAEWKRLRTPAEKGAWIRRFWDRRAAESGVTVAERLASHYKRLEIARRSYVKGSTRGASGFGVLLVDRPAGDYPFDDRGAILIRHGPPEAVVSTQAPGTLPNETWAYDLPGIGPQLFHFVTLAGTQEYALVSDITTAIDPAASRTSFGNLRNRALLSLLQDRIPLDQRYQVAAARINTMLVRQPMLPLDGTDVRAALENMDAEYRTGARRALRTDTYRRPYEGALSFLHDVFAFRTPFSRTELTAAFAVPASQLEPLAASNNSRFALKLSAILLDTLQGTVTRMDTTVEVQLAQPPGPRDYVHAHVTLPVIPSEHTVYTLVAEDMVGGRGSSVDGSRRLRDFSSSENLLVSDIVLARPSAAGEWRRGDQTFRLALPRSFAPSSPFTVFYEVYNFEPGERFSTHISAVPVNRSTLQRVFGGGPRPVDVRFDGIASPGSDGVQQEVREVATELEPGRYRMTITVTAQGSRRTAVTETLFEVK